MFRIHKTLCTRPDKVTRRTKICGIILWKEDRRREVKIIVGVESAIFSFTKQVHMLFADKFHKFEIYQDVGLADY